MRSRQPYTTRFAARSRRKGMRSSNIRAVWSICVTLCLLGVGCIGTVDGPGYEQEESPATAVDPNADPDSDAYDEDASAPGAEPVDDGTSNGGNDDDPPVSNPPPGSTGNPDASLPPGSQDAGVAQPPPTPPPAPPPPPSGDDAEAASLERGAALYPAMCAGCHGARGTGASAPSLTDNRPFDGLVSKIDSSMPPRNANSCDRTCAEDLARFILATFAN